MSKRAVWGAGLALTLVGTAMVAGLGSDNASDGDATTYLTDRLWIERMPDGDRDMVGKLAVVRSVDHGRFGVTELGSVWRHHTEVFRWRLEDSTLHTAWPQDGQHVSIELRTRECEGEAPEPFELCLDYIDDGEEHTLYSRHDWVVRPRREGEDLVDDPLVAAWIESVTQALPEGSVAQDPEVWGSTTPPRPGLWRR